MTGMIDIMSAWSPFSAIDPSDLEALAAWLPLRSARTLPGPFDVAGPTCPLSQLLDTVGRALPLETSMAACSTCRRRCGQVVCGCWTV